MLRLTRTANPVVLPVSVDEFKTQTRLDYLRPETYPRLVEVATAAVEAFTRRSLITQEWTLQADSFPGSRTFVLPRGPLQTVTAITYLDPNGLDQTVSTSLYGFAADGRVYLLPGESWPTGVYEVPGAVTITYVTGYGDQPEDLPHELRHAVMMLAVHYFDAPGATSEKDFKQVPFGLTSLLSPFKNPFDINTATV